MSERFHSMSDLKFLFDRKRRGAGWAPTPLIAAISTAHTYKSLDRSSQDCNATACKQQMMVKIVKAILAELLSLVQRVA